MSLNIPVVRDWILSNFEEISSCEEAANHFCVGLETLRRRFALYQGLTMFQYIKRLKLERAKELLRSDNLRCFEIAYRMRLGSPQHAARAFKGECGMTMTEYRKQQTMHGCS